MSARVSIAERAPWLGHAGLQRLFDVLEADGGEARVAGGAVRNVLMGQAVSDVDIATTHVPQAVLERAEAAGMKVVPTGIDHGTVTVVVDGTAYEVTTLREDVATDGRRAKVAFGRDWKRDAERRDFTINALYADRNGNVVDPVGGLSDIDTRTVRFIGSAQDRIREDYLRILRFFRFFAWYGEGRPDAEGLKAVTRLKDGLAQLSAERVWSELRKLLSAPDPSRALLWMRQTGVLTAILPESEKWGIDAIHALAESEVLLKLEPDPLLRLMSIVPPDGERMRGLAKRLRMSRAETDRLVAWAQAPIVAPELADQALEEMLYRQGTQPILDRIALAASTLREKAAGGDQDAMKSFARSRQILQVARGWQRPAFPVSGADLKQLGLAPGVVLGETLKALENEWVAGGFTSDKAELLTRARSLMARIPSK